MSAPSNNEVTETHISNLAICMLGAIASAFLLTIIFVFLLHTNVIMGSIFAIALGVMGFTASYLYMGEGKVAAPAIVDTVVQAVTPDPVEAPVVEKAPVEAAPVVAPTPVSAPVAHPELEVVAVVTEPVAMHTAADKPATLTAAREGGADDLKQIKGVGPKMEELLNSMGFYHFDQLAAWTDSEIAWVDENLEGFKGRVTRDEWVSQAKDLAK